MKRLSLLAVLILTAVSATMPIEPAWGQRPDGTWQYSFSYAPLYQLETDLDGGGSFDVNRHYLRLGLMRSFGPKLRMGLGLNYDVESWNFDGLSSLAQASPWSTIHRPGISLPIFYTFADSWTFGFAPAVDFSGESGADIDESLAYGGVISLSHSFGRKLRLGLGFGLFDQLEETAFFPYLVINWKINEQFRIANPFRAGPAGPAGLELIFTPTKNWEMGAGGAYRSYRFRLDDNNTVSNGVGENQFMVAFVRIQRKLRAKMTLDLTCGALFEGELSIEDSNGRRMAKAPYDDPAPIFALTVAGRF